MAHVMRAMVLSYSHRLGSKQHEGKIFTLLRFNDEVPGSTGRRRWFGR
jgi:hypothetical protein